jgi:hypothetical protein
MKGFDKITNLSKYYQHYTQLQKNEDLFGTFTGGAPISPVTKNVAYYVP